MANLPESATYDAGVYQLELTDPVQGGSTGVSNAPLKNLANRTAWLKSQIDGINNGTIGLALYARLASPTFTGSPSAPTAALGDSTTKLATTDFVQKTLGGFLSKSIAGTGSVTLTAVEAGNGIITFTGALTGNRNVIVPSSPTRPWIIRNATTGAFTVTVKTAAGAGVEVAQGQNAAVFCDGTNVLAGESWAAPLASPALTGTPTAPTPAQFDSSTKLATTDFAWQQGLHFQNGAGITLTANTTLTASQAGHWFESQASNLTITLPPIASFSSGMATYTFRAPLAFTLKANGSEIIRSASGEAANTLSVASGECVTVVGNGFGGHWFVVLGGFGSASFSKSFGMSGYQKLPSGLIIQWGSGSTAADGSIAVTFPIAFPTACVGIHGTHSGGALAAMFEVFGTRSTTGVTTKTVNNLNQSSSGWSVSWLAIGY